MDMEYNSEHMGTKKEVYAELRGALMEVKESIEGKRKLNTLDNLINELANDATKAAVEEA